MNWEKLQVPAWLLAVLVFIIVILLVVSFFTGMQVTLNPFGFTTAAPTYQFGQAEFSSRDITCGTIADPCMIKFKRKFAEEPRCFISPWNPDDTGYAENPVIRTVTSDRMEVWRGSENKGTSIIVSWVCFANAN